MIGDVSAVVDGLFPVATRTFVPHYRTHRHDDQHHFHIFRQLRGGGDSDNGCTTGTLGLGGTSSIALVTGSSNVDGSTTSTHDVAERDAGSQPRRPRKVLILMDGFCPYHGGYLEASALHDFPATTTTATLDGLTLGHGDDDASNNDDQNMEEESSVAVELLLSNYLCDYLQAMADTAESSSSSAAAAVPTSILPVGSEEYERYESMRVPVRSKHNFRNGLENDSTEQASSSFTHDTKERFNKLVERLKEAEVVAIYCESDSGLADAEALRQALVDAGVRGVLRDDPIQYEARRNKYHMHQAVQSRTGLPVVRQKLCHSLAEAWEFLDEEQEQQQQRQQVEGEEHNKRYVVVKPIRGVASESVYRCSNRQEVQQAWEKITSSTIFGSHDLHSNVLVQEYLLGTEYAVDVVTRNGEHKVAAIWRYEKHPANGAAFCYFQTELVDESTDPVVRDVCEYIRSTLSVLGIQWGLTHNEVIVTQDRGPLLVEVNCRQHNMDFAPITMSCIGYNALDMLLQAYFGEFSTWEQFPAMPTLRAYGCMVHLVNYASGRLVNVNHLEELENLESVLDWHVYEEFQNVGSSVLRPTIDIRSDAGWVQLCHPDRETLRRDYETILNWMPTMFQVEEEC